MKHQSQPVILPIIKPVNLKAHKTANLLSLVGIAVIALVVFTLGVGILRTIMVLVGILLLIAPFIFKFFFNTHESLGYLNFTPDQIVVKLKKSKPETFKTTAISDFSYVVKDFEGETKVTDMLTTASTLKVRSGADNYVSWIHDKQFHEFNFKLGTHLSKQSAIAIFETYQNLT